MGDPVRVTAFVVVAIIAIVWGTLAVIAALVIGQGVRLRDHHEMPRTRVEAGRGDGGAHQN